MYWLVGFASSGRSVPRISIAPRDSRGSACSLPASVHQSAISSCSFSGCCSARSVHSLGSCVGVEQLPLLLVEVAPGLGRRRHGRRGLPPLVPDRPGPEHRVELRLLLRRRVGVVEAVAEADPLDRVLRVAVHHVGHLDAHGLQERRHDVDRVGVLPPERADVLDLRRPGHDQRVGGAALEVRVALPHLERRVERPRPPGRVVVVGLRAAELVEQLQVLLGGVGDAVEELVLVDRPVRPAFARRAVVGDQHDDRVLELPAVLQVVEQPPELVVEVAQEAGVDLGHPTEQLLLVLAQGLPRPDDVELRPRLAVVAGLARERVDRRQLGALGEQSHLLLPLEHALAVRLVAHVEHALVLVGPLPRYVVRRVGGAGAVVEEERLVGRDRLRVLHELDRLVRDVDREVVAVLGRAPAGRPGGCRGSGRGTTGSSRRRGTRSTARSPRPSGHWRFDEARFISSSAHRCHLPTM